MGTWKPRRVFYPHYIGRSVKATLSTDAHARYGEAFAKALYEASAAGDPDDVIAGINTLVRAYDADGKYTPALVNRIFELAGVPPNAKANIEDAYQIWTTGLTPFVSVLDAFEVRMADYDNESNADEDGGGERARILHTLSCPDPSTAG